MTLPAPTRALDGRAWNMAATMARGLHVRPVQGVYRAGCRDRTDDIFFTREVLYQLS